MSNIAGTFLDDRSDEIPKSNTTGNGEDERIEEWDRLPDEPERAYAAFIAYRDLGPSARSIARAADVIKGKIGESLGTGEGGRARRNSQGRKKPPANYEKWSSTYRWVERAAAWDAHLERIARRKQEEAHAKQIEEYQDRQRRLAVAQQTITLRLLKRIADVLDILPPVERPANGTVLDMASMLPSELTTAVYAATRLGTTASESEARALGVDAILNYVAESAQSE